MSDFATKASEHEPPQIIKEPDVLGPNNGTRVPGTDWTGKLTFDPNPETPWVGGGGPTEPPARGGTYVQPPAIWDNRQPDLGPVDNPFSKEAQEAIKKKKEAEARAREEEKRKLEEHQKAHTRATIEDADLGSFPAHNSDLWNV